MTEDELRALVRSAIARHLGAAAAPSRAPGPAPGAVADPAWRAHPSFGKFLVLAGNEDDGACLIEPSVRCNHCGYCQSYGH